MYIKLCLEINSLFDFYKKIWYNIYTKVKKGIKNMFDDFTTEIQSDEIASLIGNFEEIENDYGDFV